MERSRREFSNAASRGSIRPSVLERAGGRVGSDPSQAVVGAEIAQAVPGYVVHQFYTNSNELIAIKCETASSTGPRTQQYRLLKGKGFNFHPNRLNCASFCMVNPRPVGLLPDPARRRGGGAFRPPLLSPKLLRRFSKFKRCSIALSKFYLETKFH